MIGELLKIAGQCDGVRCDMAMLVLPDVFERTWGRRAPLFWPRATERVRERVPGFCFMAEVYWDLEWTMLQQGFDYAYDKRLYDRLREGHARPVREHLLAGLDYQDKLARFLENHDEPRAAATFAPRHARGRGRHHVSVAGPAVLPPGPVRGPPQAHLAAPGPRAAGAAPTQRCSSSTTGSWRCSGSRPCAMASGACSSACPAWDGNWTCGVLHRLVLARLRTASGGCGGQLCREPEPVLRASAVSRAGRPAGAAQGSDGARQLRSDGSELVSRGLYLDLPPWGYHVFEVTAV